MPLHRIPVALADKTLEAIERAGEVVVAAFPEGDVYVVITQVPVRAYETRAFA